MTHDVYEEHSVVSCVWCDVGCYIKVQAVTYFFCTKADNFQMEYIWVPYLHCNKSLCKNQLSLKSPTYKPKLIDEGFVM